VRFRERQVLRAADLELEQSYLTAMRRRHNIGQHGWGIVSGLELTMTPAGVAIVRPGMAVDGYGRELFVHAPLELPADAFDTLGSDSLDVWLFYDLMEMSVPQRGSWDCGPGQNSRTREQSRLRLTISRGVDPRGPIEVPDDDLLFPPQEMPPDSPAREWPIFLGTITRTNSLTRRYDAPRSSRPYATLVGESVVAPSGRARMQVGSELEQDTRRFAVAVTDAANKAVERLAIDRNGDTTLTGNTTLDVHPGAKAPPPRLRMREHIVQSASDGEAVVTEPLCDSGGRAGEETLGAARTVRFLPLAATPAQAAPWQIYRTSVQEEGRTLQQLRVEMAHPGDKGNPQLYKLTVGTRDTSGDFNACLTLTADCTLTIEGDVNVLGQLVEGPVQADPSDPRFAKAIVDQWAAGWLSGEAALGNLFSDLNSGELGVEIVDLNSRDGTDPPQPVTGNSITVGQDLLYTYRVTNGGRGTITNIQLYESRTFNDQTEHRKIPSAPFSLGPNEQPKEFTQTFSPGSTAGVIQIAVTAIGVGSQPSVLGASNSETVAVTSKVT